MQRLFLEQLRKDAHHQVLCEGHCELWQQMSWQPADAASRGKRRVRVKPKPPMWSTSLNHTLPFIIHSGLLLVRHCPSSALQSCLPSAPTWCRSGGFGRSGLPVIDWKRHTTPLIQRRWLRVWHRLAVDYCADAWLFVATIRRQQRWCFRQLRLVGNCTLGRVQSL